MDVFKGQNLLEFSDRFKTDEDCKEYLASIKAKSEYKCTRCNHTACQIRKDLAIQCNICGHIECLSGTGHHPEPVPCDL